MVEAARDFWSSSRLASPTQAEVWKKYFLLSPHKGVQIHFTDLLEQCCK